MFHAYLRLRSNVYSDRLGMRESHYVGRFDKQLRSQSSIVSLPVIPYPVEILLSLSDFEYDYVGNVAVKESRAFLANSDKSAAKREKSTMLTGGLSEEDWRCRAEIENATAPGQGAGHLHITSQTWNGWRDFWSSRAVKATGLAFVSGFAAADDVAREEIERRLSADYAQGKDRLEVERLLDEHRLSLDATSAVLNAVYAAIIQPLRA